MPTLMRLIAGIAAGSIAWGTSVLLEGSDGAVFRIIFGIIASTVFVGFMWILGFPCRHHPIAGLWRQLRPLLLLAIVTGVVILLFSDRLGLMHDEIDPDTGNAIRVMNFRLTLLAYFSFIFPIVNWPTKPAAL